MAFSLVMIRAQALRPNMMSNGGIMWNAGEKWMWRSGGDRVLAGVASVGTWRMIILVMSVGRSMINK
ncbi:hypothetical protein A2U01_0078111, partial [Trifolium medium]|nr:hypothetical protein [Trifolium medium]